MPATPASFTENSQCFEFGATAWQRVEKFDNSPVHVAINKSVQNIQGVDFIAMPCVANKSSIALIEAKDYRSTTPPLHDSIARELAAKVLGTICGVTAAARLNQDDPAWQQVAKKMIDPKHRLKIFLHVEMSTRHSIKDLMTELGVLAVLLEQKLAWLDKCDVICCSERLPKIADCKVVTI